MAITITHVTDAVSASSTTSLTTSAVVNASVGDWLVVVLAMAYPNSGVGSYLTSIGDSDGINTYTTRAQVGYSDGGATNVGQEIVVATCAVTDALTNASITANFNDSLHDKTLTIYRLQGSGLSFVAADTTGSTGTVTNHSAATVSVSNGNIIFGAAAVETNDSITGDSDTSNGSWSTVVAALADGGIDSTSTTGVSQYKTVTGTGNQSWTCSTTSARRSARTYVVIHGSAAAFSIPAAQGSYALSGTAMTPKLGNVPIVAGAGSYALTGTAATFINTGVNKSIVADAGFYSLLGTDATLTHGYKLDATIAGSYSLTGTDATLRRALPMVADAGAYSLLGTDVTLTKASLVNKVLGVDPGIYALTGTDATLRIAFKVDATTAGSYALTGSAVALVTAANKALLAEAGSYALVGTDATPTIMVAPPSVSPLHIGEWPLDKKRRRRREDAAAAEQRARKRFRDAIGRLLEGLPPEFDEPADLDEALDSAVQASNLLYAMSAPIREINAVNELIDHIRQLRIAQPIAQLHLAQAYNQAHRYLAAKAEEDTVLTLLLGE